jgi:signal transduction histidine kinase
LTLLFQRRLPDGGSLCRPISAGVNPASDATAGKFLPLLNFSSRESEAGDQAFRPIPPERDVDRMASLIRIIAGIGERLRAVPLARRIILLTAILLAAVYASSALILARYYTALGERERDARDARAQLLAEHAGRALAAVDLALETIAETLKPRLPLTRPTLATQRLLDKYVKSLPQVRALAVIDADGVTLNNSRAFPPPKLNASQRSFFTAQKKSGGAGLYLGRIATSRVDRQSFFAMSRPIFDNAGNFQGVVAAITDPRYFAYFYTPQAEQATAAVLFERDDGAVLASAGVPCDAPGASERHPMPDRARVAIGEVRGFPAKIVLIGKPIIALPQFTILVATDLGLLIVMTAMGVYLAATAAREAAAVEREAQARHIADQVQRLFVDALEHIPSGLMLCDAEDRIVFCNSATRQYFPNVTELLVPGTPFETLVRAQVASLYLPAATADPEGWIAERMAQHRAGTTYAVRAYADGRWAQIIERRTANGCTIGIRTDITEIKLKEEALRQSEEAERAARQAAEQADQAKNAFLANMSHELRTPLNAIIGFSEMIALAVRGPLPETYRHYGELVCSSGLHLLSIISDMLDIAKLNSGKAELRLEPIDVAAIIDEAVSMMSEKAAGAGVRITTDLTAQCPRIEADPLRLRQVLLNLLGNAVKFTPSGGQVEIATAVLAPDRTMTILRITVADTGIGMTPEDIPRALEPFTQVGNNAQRGREGTGLGLPISKTLIELHGGRFEIASAPERGTTVTIDLPLHRPDEPTADAWELDVAV